MRYLKGVKAVMAKAAVKPTTNMATTAEASAGLEMYRSRCSFSFLFVFDINCVNFVPGMDRIIGIDYGRKRTGLAVSDPLGIFASPLDTVPSANIIEYLRNYAEKERIVRIVIGMPVNMNGAPSEAAADINAFLPSLRRAFPGVPVETEDERFTSVLAHRAMIDGGMKASRRRDKKEVDRISASIILQTYLDRQKQ